MLCLSLWQPWATLWVLGIKRNETRSWSTKVRGTIGIHAAKRRIDEETRRYFINSGIREHIWTHYNLDVLGEYHDIPFGAILGSIELIDCVPVEQAYDLSQEPFASGVGDPFAEWPEPDVPIDYYLGDYSPGRYAWRGSEPILLPEAVPYRGAQGLFEIGCIEGIQETQLAQGMLTQYGDPWAPADVTPSFDFEVAS